ncbi:MAG TPA: hypothetical protein VNG33_10755 [Polyangiaceae bacterium]|nr:hypothetical protein [Polyangiaceae bacterium]
MTASFADTEIWHVLMDGNDMKRLNVDQLDDAFRLSLVDASTMVWKAGMKTWQRLGAVAGMDDEEPVALAARRAPPAPPRPIARPAPHPPSRAPAAFHTAVTPVFQTQMLVPPVFTQTLHAPDPYVLPKRRVAIPSEVDFRRAPGGTRFGRWAFALLLITGGVLGAYRQNLLREGARQLGVETKYLAGEHRATAFVTAKAPSSLKNVLTRLALLPGPNAVTQAALMTPTPTPPAAAAVGAPVVAAAKPSTATNSEPEVKTVSLDSLPVLPADAPAAKAPVAAAVAAPIARAKPVAAAVRAEPKTAPEPTRAAKVAKAEKAEKPEPVAKAEPAPKVKAEAPPPANESFLKSAIRSAIAADNAKNK